VLLGGADRNDEARVLPQARARLDRSEKLEPERAAMKQVRFAHWELAAVIAAGCLGAWVRAAGTFWALAALVAALAALGLALWTRHWRALLLAAVSLAGAGGTLVAAWRIRAVETRWPAVREGLVEDAQRRLDATLGQAVDLARRLATRAAAVTDTARAAQFAALRAAVSPGAPENGVVLFDSTGRPVAWAGRHRVPVTLPRDELDATITPFYAVLTARRQQGPWTAASQVLLAADSSVPDRQASVAERFAAQTGVGLEFFAPRTAPAVSTDVFDYCLGSCKATNPTSLVPDTLFSVRAVPPRQGDRKLELLAGGRWWAAVAATVALLLLAAVGGSVTRYAAATELAAIYLLTPAGEQVGLGGAFSAATYFFSPLGPIGASAGALLLTAALIIVATAGLWRRGWGGGRLGRLGAGALMLAVPLVLVWLQRGITLLPSGSSMALWLLWQTSIAAAGCALLALAAALLHGPRTPTTPRWTPWLACLWAGTLAVVGLALWSPLHGWPVWYVLLWVPALTLAVLPSGVVRMVAPSAVVVGCAAAVLVWGKVARDRIGLADRDLERVEAGQEGITPSLLDRFAAELLAGPPPMSAGALYHEWQHSPLAQEDYPAVLATWDLSGRLVARLDLAELDLPAPLLQALARSAADDERPVVESLRRVPGMHYVLAAPFRDGAVVTVGVGPRSRVFPPVRVAQFLRGERVAGAPYEITASESFTRLPTPAGWRRDGWVARTSSALDLPGPPRYVHLRVDLGNPAQLLVRGVLVVLVDMALVLVLWMAGHALAGPVPVPHRLPERLWPLSYRSRLALALGVFFVAPTIGFAAWSLERVRADVDDDAALLTRQTLRDASNATRDMGPDFGGQAAEGLRDLGNRFGADLLVYQSGVLVQTSTPILQQLGLVDAYLPPAADEHLLVDHEEEFASDAAIGGRETHVGYRSIGPWGGRPVVLGSPRLLDDAQLVEEREDLALTLTLVTLAGLVAAVGLAGLAARALAKPVHVLRAAAESVGRGQPLPPRDPTVPPEFVPVVEGLERMADDVRASQAALEAARQRTAAVLRSVATGVVALDRAQRVTMANPRAEELLGVGLREGAPVRELTGGHWQSLWEWVEAFAHGGNEPEANELVVGERRIRAQVAALADGGCVVALDDTTDLARAVRVLAWGELARQIAHEIKNPLTPLRLGIQHLERAYRDRRADYAETLRRTAGQILAEIERLDSIARAFARFGAPPAEAGPLARENVAEAARETAQLYALGAGTAVQVEAPAAVYARVRRDEFKEVLVNLVENARTAGAARVRIVLRSEDGTARVAVTDDGQGIPPEDLPRIFEPQFSTTTSGTGLGLAICKRLVESWGGVISVASAAGQGTTVTIDAGA
jgi:two-component system nitrogen regulation sensor histidine kinase NtrY